MLLGIDRELVPPNGSGDTTYNYVAVLVGFLLACLIHVVWSLVDRSKTNYALSRDFLFICLRYTLVSTMIGQR